MILGKGSQGGAMRGTRLIVGLLLAAVGPSASQAARVSEELAALISRNAKKYSVPEALVYRVIERESRFDPAVRKGPNWGLMQIREQTARNMGFSGPVRLLLDPEINLTYAVAYLANAYQVAGGNQERAIVLYTSGYYYEAKRRGMLSILLPKSSLSKSTSKPGLLGNFPPKYSP
jgi:soluble lytic murein transglycosylase-like protein